MKRNRARFLRIAFVSALLLCTSSCAEEATIESKSSGAHSISIGTNGELISIQSDNVQMTGYDATTQTMKVQFDNGSLYEYYGVSPELWTAFLDAQPHPWSQVGYPRLVSGGVPYKRIG